MAPAPTQPFDEAAIVADLEPRSLDGLHEVQVVLAFHLARDDVAYPEFGVIGGRHGAKLANLQEANNPVAILASRLLLEWHHG
jgi:hypothetical protein